MILSAEEFGRLAIQEIDALARFAGSLTRNPAEADDLVQETYLRALRARESFEFREHGLRPWLLRILHNTFLTRVTQSKRQPAVVDIEDLQLPAQESEPFPNTPDRKST